MFLLSLAFLSYLYGSAARQFGWFPDPQLAPIFGQAVEQARALNPFRLPVYLGPRVHEREGVVRSAGAEDEDEGRGLTLISSAWEETSWKPALRLVDSNGSVLHEWIVDPARVLPRTEFTGLTRRDLDIQGSHLFENGDVLVNVEYTGMLRMDACGEVLWTLMRGNHHSIARAGDGSFWVPGVTELGPARSEAFPGGFPGLEQPIFKDLILKVGGDGEVVSEIGVLDVLYQNDLERYIPRAGVTGREDVTHLNDVEPLPDSIADEYPLFDAGDLLLSLRNLDLVLVLDPGSRRVEWVAYGAFHRQHDPDFLGDGWIGIFDNNSDGTDRGTMAGGSRVVALQPTTDSVEVLFPTSDSVSFYTPYRGKWQMLPNGHMMLVEAVAGRLVEAAPDGTVVWEWYAPTYEGSHVPEVADGRRYFLDRSVVESWPCSAGTGGRAAPESGR